MSYRTDKFEFERVFKGHLASRGMSQTFLAKRLHVHRATLSKWISGANNISFTNTQKVSQILQLSDEEANQFFRLAGYANYLYETSENAESAAYEAVLFHEVTDLRIPQVFVGRSEHLNVLLSALRKNEHVLLSGYGGVGKSTLAKNICQHLMQEQQKPVLWVGVHSANLRTLFESLLTPLNQREKIAATEGTATSQVVRRELARANLALIVIDALNTLADLTELRYAIPRGLPLLITSRKQATNIDFCYQIASMNVEEGLDLLSRHAKNRVFSIKDYLQFQESIELCERLDYHPFCLTAAGTWLRERTTHPAKLLERLDLNLPAPTKIPIPEDYISAGWETVHALLNNSFLELAPTARQLLDIIGSLEFPLASAGLLSYLTGVHIFEVEDQLQELYRWNLAEPVGNKSTRIHDLIHTWAQVNKQEQEEDKDKLSQAVIEYVSTNSKNGRFLDLVTDLPNILPFAADGNDEVCEAIIKPLATQGFQDLYGHRFDYLALLDRTIEIVEHRRGDDGFAKEDEVDLHHLLSKRGNAYFDLGEYRMAVASYKYALQLAYNESRHIMLNGLVGKALRSGGQLAEADMFLENAIRGAFRTEDHFLIGFVLQQDAHSAGIQGKQKMTSGDIEDAIVFYTMALKAADLQEAVLRDAIADHIRGDIQEYPLDLLKNSLLRALINKATAVLRIDEARKSLHVGEAAVLPLDEEAHIQQAIALLQEAMMIAKEIDIEELESHAHWALTEALHQAERRQEAQDHIIQANTLFKKFGQLANVYEVMEFAADQGYSIEPAS